MKALCLLLLIFVIFPLLVSIVERSHTRTKNNLLYYTKNPHLIDELLRLTETNPKFAGSQKLYVKDKNGRLIKVADHHDVEKVYGNLSTLLTKSK